MLNLRNTLASQVGAVILDSLEAAVGQFKYLLPLEHMSQRNAYIGHSGGVCVCVCVCVQILTITSFVSHRVSEAICCAVLCLITQSCPTLCDPMDNSLPGSSLHGIPQAGMQEWVAMNYSRDIPY